MNNSSIQEVGGRSAKFALILLVIVYVFNFIDRQILTILAEDLKRTQIVQYAGASGDYNPLHTDDKFTKEIAGYPGVFAHGMLSMGMTGKMLTNFVGDGTLKKYGVRFTNQVWPGDSLESTATVIDIKEEDGETLAEIAIETKNQDGATVITGSAIAKVGK